MGLYLSETEGEALSSTMHFMSRERAPALTADRVHFALLPNPWGVSIAVLFNRAEAERFIFGRPDAVFAWVERETFVSALGAERAAELGYGSTGHRKDHTDASL